MYVIVCAYLCVYMCVFMYIMHIYVCVFTGAALPMRRGAMHPLLLAVMGGYKGVHRFRVTRGYMKISMCYELSLHVDNDLR